MSGRRSLNICHSPLAALPRAPRPRFNAETCRGRPAQISYTLVSMLQMSPHVGRLSIGGAVAQSRDGEGDKMDEEALKALNLRLTKVVPFHRLAV